MTVGASGLTAIISRFNNVIVSTLKSKTDTVGGLHNTDILDAEEG